MLVGNKWFGIHAGCILRKISRTLGKLKEYNPLGICKSFKDKISPLSTVWKTSGTVKLTRGGNPKPPNDEIVCTWVKTAWRNVDRDVIMKSIVRAGFHDDFEELHISRHNIFGTRFKSIWVSNISKTVTEFELLKGEEEDPFLLEDGLQETIVVED
jgi:hypothetical protein